ncbi:MAG: hypothetical protein QOF68_677, partial [Gaiellales bacterium]|nr:hypothetical protein [Gaiellales bacterium]
MLSSSRPWRSALGRVAVIIVTVGVMATFTQVAFGASQLDQDTVPLGIDPDPAAVFIY